MNFSITPSFRPITEELRIGPEPRLTPTRPGEHELASPRHFRGGQIGCSKGSQAPCRIIYAFLDPLGKTRN